MFLLLVVFYFNAFELDFYVYYFSFEIKKSAVCGGYAMESLKESEAV